ncbi:Cell wall / vacuolar inhibitor of fructosidase [Vigna angularis]|uniref:Cell wall / vacuolar inhibitor of fructosidase n=1 Tax=Phaseolus angularis TaxID=3914 RepID=A0A8T0L8Z8_PHAAN|nr:cell wall / vacuolar inhibitor of fructosidase 1-like [Vigna angularis]KAG2407328.1 Cell wall / vacuolar inhibitor of fructosidase [Vigna angularis]
MKPPSFIFYTVVIATISVPAATNCRVVLLNKANLIEETCKQTPHQNLCIQYLSSDPRSADADIAGLALIMVNVIKTKANNALDKIQQLLQGSHEHSQKEALNSCAGRYKTILEADVAQAIAALQKGDPKFAEDGANDAAVEATSCENGFSGKSPLTNENNAMHDVAVTTGAIVRQLL